MSPLRHDQSLCRTCLQVEQLQQELQDRDSRVAAATQAAQESKQQLAAVMAAQSAAAEAARAHEAQLNQLRAELQIALDALEANAQANGVRMASRSTSMSLPPGVVTAGLDLPGLVQQLQSGLDHVSVRVSQLSVELGGRCGAVEETVRELKTAREASEATAASLAEQLAAVTAAVEQQGVAHAELLGRFTEADKDRESLQGQLGELVQVCMLMASIPPCCVKPSIPMAPSCMLEAFAPSPSLCR